MPLVEPPLAAIPVIAFSSERRCGNARAGAPSPARFGLRRDAFSHHAYGGDRVDESLGVSIRAPGCGHHELAHAADGRDGNDASDSRCLPERGHPGVVVDQRSSGP